MTARILRFPVTARERRGALPSENPLRPIGEIVLDVISKAYLVVPTDNSDGPKNILELGELFHLPPRL